MDEINSSVNDVVHTINDEKKAINSAVSIANSIDKGLDSIKASYVNVDENLILVNNLLKNNHNSVLSMDASLTSTTDAYQHVESEISSLREQIDKQKIQTDNILTLKDNLSDISSSINILTSRYNMDLLSENRKQLELITLSTIKKPIEVSLKASRRTLFYRIEKFVLLARDQTFLFYEKRVHRTLFLFVIF